MKMLEHFYQIGSSNQSHFYDASVYVVDTGEGLLLVDCGTPDGFDALVKNLQDDGLAAENIKWILATHGHYDHVGAASLWKTLCGCKLYMHEADRVQVEQGDSIKTTASILYDREFTPVQVDEELSHGQTFTFPHVNMEVIHTPGHTPGGVCFALSIDGVSLLIGGDTLWGGYSETIGSDEQAWRNSLDELCNRHFDLLTFGHTGPLLHGAANQRLAEMKRQFAVYYNPWFKPMSETFKY